MSLPSELPISDEQAKFLRELISAVRDSGSYVADILGDLPKDLLGYLVGDRIKAARAERLSVIWEKSKKRLEDRGVTDPEPPSLKLALPILEAAADENHEEISGLWERLLANAMDPSRRGRVRQAFIRTVKQMDPMDVLVLKAVADNGNAVWGSNAPDIIASRLRTTRYEVRVSLDNLAQLNCIYFTDSGPKVQPHLNPFGMLLMGAVAS